MKHSPNKFDIAAHAWMVVGFLTTNPNLTPVALGMMIFCTIMSLVTYYHENNKV